VSGREKRVRKRALSSLDMAFKEADEQLSPTWVERDPDQAVFRKPLDPAWERLVTRVSERVPARRWTLPRRADEEREPARLPKRPWGYPSGRAVAWGLLGALSLVVGALALAFGWGATLVIGALVAVALAFWRARFALWESRLLPEEERLRGRIRAGTKAGESHRDESRAAPAVPVDQATLASGREALESKRDEPYYDAESDEQARTDYYAAIDPEAEPAELMGALSQLLMGTHKPQPRYRPSELVYPWVDLHPDRKLRSIYSGNTFDPEEMIRADAEVEALRSVRLRELVELERALGRGTLEVELAVLEARHSYSCEHVVPQSTFAEREPMRGDLHHLFTCESKCKTFRGSIPYFDVAESERVVSDECGRKEAGGFEPNNGKGAVARATLYFLLRYPGVVGGEARDLQADRLPVLLDWHRREPVDDWERHRNMAIQKTQGNRNPFIDHRDWAERIPFDTAFGGRDA
jgi:endonuclease I